MRGAILFNGNAETEAALLDAAAPLLLSSRHGDPAVAASKRVLLVTAAWGEREHDEGHVKRRLNELGLRSQVEGGFDRTLVNLSLRHEVDELFRRRPEIAAVWEEYRRAVDRSRAFYLDHNAHLIALFRRALRDGKATEPGLLRSGLARDDGSLSLDRFALRREVEQAFRTLEANDDHLVGLLQELEQRAFDAAGLSYDPEWRAARDRLEQRILSANSIVLFGGNLDVLLDGLRLFRLREVLAEALRRGTQMVAMSAGAMVFCERIIVYDDFADTPRDFQLYDRGLSLVRDLQLFPHCMERIQTDDPDNLAFLARRFRHHVCVGLNQRSFLLFELQPRKATSMGSEDGVYVFDPSGEKACYRRGEAIPLLG